MAEIEALTPPGSRVTTKPEPKVATPRITGKGKKPNQKVSFQDLERFLGNHELPLFAVKKELSETFHGTTNAVEKMVRRYVRLGRVRKTIRNGVMYVSIASGASVKRPTKEEKRNAKSNGAYGAPNSRVFQIEALIKANGGSYPLYDLPKAMPLGTYRLNRVFTDAVENGYLKIEEKDGIPLLTRTNTPIPTTYSTKGGKGGSKLPQDVLDGSTEREEANRCQVSRARTGLSLDLKANTGVETLCASQIPRVQKKAYSCHLERNREGLGLPGGFRAFQSCGSFLGYL